MRIWTLDARDFVLLEAMTSSLALSDAAVRREIAAAWRHTTSALSSKGIDYGSLRRGLTPQRDRHEVALVFDSEQVEEGASYAYPCVERVLPLLPKSSTLSLLAGDLIAFDQTAAFRVLDAHLRLHRPATVRHTAQLYAIYVNNLSDAALRALLTGLDDFDPFIGHVPCTYGSPAKTWFSFILGTRYLKVKDTFVCGHEYDVEDDGDRNLPGWPLGERGRCVSIQGMYFDLFLSYKIERPVLPGFESDGYFALRAVSGSGPPLRDMVVTLDDSKLQYLREHKGGLLTAVAGIRELTVPTLVELIRAKIEQDYIFDLRYLAKHDASLLNIMLELVHPEHRTPTKVVVALEYRPADHELRVVTMT